MMVRRLISVLASAALAVGMMTVPGRAAAAAAPVVMSTLDSAAHRAPPGVSLWYAEESGKKVVVEATDLGAARAFVAARGIPAGAVRFVRAADRPVPHYDVRGNDWFYTPSSRCLIGFSVVGGYVTAGHCGTAGTPTFGYNHEPQGVFAGSTFPGRDMAFVRVNRNWTPRPVVVWAGGRELPVRGARQAPVGATVCRWSPVTGVHCGRVVARNVTVNYPGGTVMGLTMITACSEPGASGGGWMWGFQAQGITSGGMGNCATGGRSLYQPLIPVLLAYNLTLLTQ